MSVLFLFEGSIGFGLTTSPVHRRSWHRATSAETPIEDYRNGQTIFSLVKASHVCDLGSKYPLTMRKMFER